MTRFSLGALPGIEWPVYRGDTFVKVTKSGSRRYVKLVESYRDEAGKSRQRVIATLGRLEAVTAGESSALINGLLRTMDALSECSEALNDVLAQQLKPLIDHELSIVFYDLTTIRAEGKTSIDGDVRHYGPSKEGGNARQSMLGVVQTAEGLPIHHEVFDGNVAETRTLLPTIKTVVKRFKVRRVVLVADRGLLSLDNLEALSAVRIEDRPPEFILAVPGRRYGEFDDLMKAFHQTHCQDADCEAYGEMAW